MSLSWYPILVSLIVGVAMIAMWSMLLARGQVAELRDGSRAIRFHLVAEGVVALLLIAGAAALVLEVSWASHLAAAALGGALYTTINSPGYYAERGDTAMVIMFVGLAVLIAAALVIVLTRMA